MLRFWRNPEFIRHLRAQLRPARRLSLLVVTGVVLVLILMSNFERDRLTNYVIFDPKGAFYALTVGQFLLIGLGCAYVCGNSIARERELKTFDFQRTTRLTPLELVIGKITGEPLVPYFAVGFSLPVAWVLGLMSGYSAGSLVWLDLILISFALYASLLGLTISMLIERAAPAALLLLAGQQMFGMAFITSPFRGASAVSVGTSVSALLDRNPTSWRGTSAPFFGMELGYPAITVFLHLTFSAWLLLMLARNIKRDLPDMKLLSRPQALGLFAFFNLLMYGLVSVRLDDAARPVHATMWLKPYVVTDVAVAMIWVALVGVGIIMLSTTDELKVWARERVSGLARYLDERSTPWLWVTIAAALAYVLLVAQALVRGFPLHEWKLGWAALQVLIFAVFAVRDVLFLQWCTLTRMKNPIVKGILYLWLYYFGVGIFALTMRLAWPDAGEFFSAVFAPFTTAKWEVEAGTAGMLVGFMVQAAAVVALITFIEQRLRRAPVAVPATA